MATFVRVVELIGDERRRDATLNVDQIQSMRRLLPSDGEAPSTLVKFDTTFMVVAEHPDDIERLAAAAIAKAEGRTDGR